METDFALERYDPVSSFLNFLRGMETPPHSPRIALAAFLPKLP